MAKKRSVAERFHKKIFRRNRGNWSLRAAMQSRAIWGRLREPAVKAQLKGGRYSLLARIPEQGIGVEIGVWKGQFSKMLLQQTNPAILHLIDPWQLPEQNSSKVVLPVDDQGRIHSFDGTTVEQQDDVDAIYEEIERQLGTLANVRVHRANSLEVAPQFADRSIDWAYIDGSHYYEDVLDDLHSWYPKLKPGGLLMGDDYYWRDPSRSYTVKRAVDEFIGTVQPPSWVVFRGQFLIQV